MKKIVRLTESDLIRLVKRVIKENVAPLYNVGDKLSIYWLNDVYGSYIYLTVNKVNSNKMSCTITKLQGPFLDLKVGEKVELSINQNTYNLNRMENQQQITGNLTDLKKI